MNFFDSQIFLENMINENKDNIELIKEILVVYKDLINKQADIDIQWFKSDAEARKEFDKNHTERYKANTDYNKTLITTEHKKF